MFKQEQVEFQKFCFTVEISEKNEDKNTQAKIITIGQNKQRNIQKKKKHHTNVSMLSRGMLEDLKAWNAALLLHSWIFRENQQ